MKARHLIPIVVLFLAKGFSQDKLGHFEYEGLRVGMTTSQVDAALEKYHKREVIHCHWDKRNCLVSEFGKTVSIRLNDTGKVFSILVTDETFPFGSFRLKFLDRYGKPNKENTETKSEWWLEEPAGCRSKGGICHWEVLDVYLEEGKSQMSLMGFFK